MKGFKNLALLLSRSRQDVDDHEKIARLEQAEEELAALREREANAVRALTERDRRNHWRESIEQMIHGTI